MGEAKRKRERGTQQSEAELSNQMTLPQRVLDGALKGIDGYWSLVDRVRRDPGLFNAPAGKKWEPWCYLPVNAVVGLCYNLARDRWDLDELESHWIGFTRMLTAVTAWRMTKGVYVFDPDVVSALADSSADDDIPDELLTQLPDWCPYVSAPGLMIAEGVGIHGFFAYVDDRAFANRQHFPPELNFEVLLDPRLCSDDALMLSIEDIDVQFEVTAAIDSGQIEPEQIVEKTLEVARKKEWVHVHLNIPLGQGRFNRAIVEQTKQVARDSPQSLTAGVLDREDPEEVALAQQRIAQMEAKLAGLLLYLVSDRADIPADDELREARERVVTNERRGIRNFQAAQIKKWEVGYRIGAEIRAYEARPTESEASNGSGARKRPHVRKAHWHGFWTGARDKPDERRKRVRWLPPIPVNVTDSDDLVPTMHRVVNG